MTFFFFFLLSLPVCVLFGLIRLITLATGKHDVGTLSHTSKRGRLPVFQTHSHPGTGSATGSLRSRA